MNMLEICKERRRIMGAILGAIYALTSRSSFVFQD
jgi:hypothetical protein